MPSINLKAVASVLAMLAILVATAASGETTESGTATEDRPANESASDKAEPELTLSQENAIESANSYIEMGAFSRRGLIRQLSSSAGEGYSKKDAKFAVEYIDPDWKAEAVESAEGYVDMSGFSCQSLIEQLSSSAGEQFTEAQATYAAKKIGLC